MASNVVALRDTRIMSGDFGEFDYQKFLDWAFVESQSKSMFIRNVAVNRANDAENVQRTSNGLDFYAARYELSVEELREIIRGCDRAGISVPEMHNRLQKGVRGEALFKRPPRGRGRKKAEESNGTEG